ncbi:MAG: uridine kinase family protein [Candidatus Saccharimonadales bacterium]
MPNEPYNVSSKIFSNPPKNGKYYLVAIDGRGGAGKSTLSKHLKQLLPEFQLVCGDDYFEPIEHPIAWGGFNEQRFYDDIIKPLKEHQREINYRPYNWDTNPHFDNNFVTIGKGLLIDRCYIFSFDLDYDLKIWVETPRDVTLNRGVSRSTMPRERAEVVWRELWKPMEDKYIAETKPLDNADIVVFGDKPFNQQIS